MPPRMGPAGEFKKHKPPEHINTSSLELWNRICTDPLPREITGWSELAGVPEYSGYAGHFSGIRDFADGVRYQVTEALFFTAHMYASRGMVDNPLPPHQKVLRFNMKDLKGMSRTYTDNFLNYVAKTHQLKYSRIQEALEPALSLLPDLSDLGNAPKPDDFLLEMRQALELGKYAYLLDLFPSDPEVPAAFFQKEAARMRSEIELYWNKPTPPRIWRNA